MSELANPSGTANGPQAQAYIASVLRALGDRDPMEVFRSTPKVLSQVVMEVPEAQLKIPEAPGKWSIAQVIQHLADSELVGGNRFRMVMTHDRPPLTAYDQDLWAERLGYANANAKEALEEFTMVRRSNVRFFERLSGDDWNRVGLHSERGEESLRHLLNLYAGHDLVHLRQIDRIRAAVSKQSS